MKNTRLFFKNAALLSISAVFLRLISISFGAYITGYIGAEGTGLQSLVFSVFSPALTLASAGVNLASCRLCAEASDEKDAVRRFAKCVRYSLCASAIVGSLLFLFSPLISRTLLDNPSVSIILRMLSISIPFVSLTSAITGYFTATRRVSKNAAVQIWEVFFKIAFTVICINSLGTRTPMRCLFTVIFCSVSADILSCIILVSLFLFQTRGAKGTAGTVSGREITGKVLGITLPVSVSSFLRSGLVAIEHILIPKGLKKRGESYESAMASYGTLSGMALPVIFFPTTVLYSFTALLIPEVAEAKERGRYGEIKRISLSVIKWVLICSLGAAAVLFSLSSFLGKSIYDSTEAGRYIALLCPLIPVMYLDTAVDSILKGLGEQVYTMKINVADALISTLAVYFLVPMMGIPGYIVVIFTSEVFNFTASIIRLILIIKKQTKGEEHELVSSSRPLPIHRQIQGSFRNTPSPRQTCHPER